MFSFKYLVCLCFLFDSSFPTEGKKLRYRCDYIWDQNSQAWFKYHIVPINYQDARTTCFHEGATLASPTTSVIKAVMLKAAKLNSIHTGFHATLTAGHYFSIDGLYLKVKENEWVEGEPDNKNDTERCIAMNKEGLFYDCNCSQPLPFLCVRTKTDEKMTSCGITDNGYVLYERVWKCYKFHIVPRNFSRANLVCNAEGGHLMVVNSSHEGTVAKDLFQSNPHNVLRGVKNKDMAFIGLHKIGEQNDWRTIHGDKIADVYNYTYRGERDVGQDCAGINREAVMIHPLWCTTPHAFICEKAMDYPPVCDASKGRKTKLIGLGLNFDLFNLGDRMKPKLLKGVIKKLKGGKGIKNKRSGWDRWSDWRSDTEANTGR